MNTESEKFLQNALSLPAADRAEIAASLIRSLDSAEQSVDMDAEWAAEIKRRIESIDNGEVALVPWHSVMDEVDARLRD